MVVVGGKKLGVDKKNDYQSKYKVFYILCWLELDENHNKFYLMIGVWDLFIQNLH